MATQPDTLLQRGVRKQLTNKALGDMIRAHVPDLIREALEIASLPTQPANLNSKIAAIKLLLGKVLPDLKQVDGSIGVNLTKILLDLTNESHQIQPINELPTEATTSVSDVSEPTV